MRYNPGPRFNYCVIGGGIVGMATARALLSRDPGARLLVLEKEDAPGRHQTGHNSGVIHAGIYYAAGSLKAELCRKGEVATKDFCRTNRIAFDTPGKLVVATDMDEVRRLDAIEGNARTNGIAVQRLTAAMLAEREPRVAGSGCEALLVPATGITDYARVCRAIAGQVEEAGGEIRYNARVCAIREDEHQVLIRTSSGSRWTAGRTVICGGLQSDRLAAMAGLNIDYRIIPFRGLYYRVKPGFSCVGRHLIYPVPDPALPFLGIHLTAMIDGSWTVGPNASLGFAREGYRPGSINLRDLGSLFGTPPFWNLMRQQWRSAVDEAVTAASKRRYLEKCRRYCPELSMEDLLPHWSGIRAQAVRMDGSLVHDFLFTESARILSVGNAPSPAATSALPIGEMITAQLIS